MNDNIFFFFYNLAHQSAFFDGLVVFFAVYFPYLVILLAFLFLIFRHDVLILEHPFQVLKREWKEIFLVFFSAGLAWILAGFLKILLHTPRPFSAFPNVLSLFPETGFAFPSGHAAFFTALAMALFFCEKKVGYIFVIFAILIGFARVIAGVHFPVDILGGFILGTLISSYLSKVILVSPHKGDSTGLTDE